MVMASARTTTRAEKASSLTSFLVTVTATLRPKVKRSGPILEPPMRAAENDDSKPAPTKTAVLVSRIYFLNRLEFAEKSERCELI
jgi:hypothetical protein